MFGSEGLVDEETPGATETLLELIMVICFDSQEEREREGEK